MACHLRPLFSCSIHLILSAPSLGLHCSILCMTHKRWGQVPYSSPYTTSVSPQHLLAQLLYQKRKKGGARQQTNYPKVIHIYYVFINAFSIVNILHINFIWKQIKLLSDGIISVFCEGQTIVRLHCSMNISAFSSNSTVRNSILQFNIKTMPFKASVTMRSRYVITEDEKIS